jgi:hypothetical protein
VVRPSVGRNRLLFTYHSPTPYQVRRKFVILRPYECPISHIHSSQAGRRSAQASLARTDERFRTGPKAASRLPRAVGKMGRRGVREPSRTPRAVRRDAQGGLRTRRPAPSSRPETRERGVTVCGPRSAGGSGSHITPPRRSPKKSQLRTGSWGPDHHQNDPQGGQ